MTRRIIGFTTTPETAQRIGFAIGVLTIARDTLWPKLTKKQKEGFDQAINGLEGILKPELLDLKFAPEGPTAPPSHHTLCDLKSCAGGQECFYRNQDR